MKIRIAILGVGRWGVHFVRTFLEHPQAEIVALVDHHQERLNYCQEQFQLESNQVILSTDWNSLRGLDKIDAVVVSTPATTHYSLIADALQLGYHVLAEKPLTLDPLECLELTRLAQQQQRQLFIDHTYLFHPAVEKGLEIVQSGKLGKLRYGYGSRTHLGPVREDVDVLWDLAIHDLAIFNQWLGQLPTQVQAQGSIWLQKDGKGKSPGLADLVWVRLIYPDGFEAYIHLCWLNPDKQRRLCLVGNQGTLIFDEMSQDSPLILQQGYLQQEGERFIPRGQSCEKLTVEATEPLRKVCECFLEAINSRQTSTIASGWVGTQLVQILKCLSLSLEQQGAIIEVPTLLL